MADEQTDSEENGDPVIDWSKCPGVESVPDKQSGAWVFIGTRTPVSLVMANAHYTPEQIAADITEGISVEAIRSILSYAREQRKNAPHPT